MSHVLFVPSSFLTVLAMSICLLPSAFPLPYTRKCSLFGCVVSHCTWGVKTGVHYITSQNITSPSCVPVVSKYNYVYLKSICSQKWFSNKSPWLRNDF
jgi:hypothetical protein